MADRRGERLGSGAALWIAFGTAIAIVLVAATDFVVGIRRQAALARVATAAGALAVFLIVALVLGGASMSWLMVVGGGVIELMALGTLGVQGRRAATKVTARPEPREARRRP